MTCIFHKSALHCVHDTGVKRRLPTRGSGIWRQRHWKTWECRLDPLYRYLLEHGVQLAWLAGQLGMTRGYLVQMFRGQMAPPPGFIERAAEVLEIPVARVRPKSSAARQVKRASEERDDDGA